MVIKQEGQADLEVVEIAAAGLQGGDPVHRGAGQHVQQHAPAQRSETTYASVV
jgi:hypothetical protein